MTGGRRIRLSDAVCLRDGSTIAIAIVLAGCTSPRNVAPDVTDAGGSGAGVDISSAAVDSFVDPSGPRDGGSAPPDGRRSDDTAKSPSLPPGTITLFAAANDFLRSIAVGPDQNLWFVEQNNHAVARMTLTGVVTEFHVPNIVETSWIPEQIIAGRDGALWLSGGDSTLRRISVDGEFETFPLPSTRDSGPDASASARSQVNGMAVSRDGKLWFATTGDRPEIGYLSPSRNFTFLETPVALSRIVEGPDGNIWGTSSDGSQIVRVSPLGPTTTFTIPTRPPPKDLLTSSGIVAGPDNNVWFVDVEASKVGRINPLGSIIEFAIPTPFSNWNFEQIVAGPDGAIWIPTQDGLARVTIDGVVSAHALGTHPIAVTVGPDGNLWFTTSREIARLVL
jgi:virginiamycin B lyase